jgi:hypothetical protein
LIITRLISLWFPQDFSSVSNTFARRRPFEIPQGSTSELNHKIIGKKKRKEKLASDAWCASCEPKAWSKDGRFALHQYNGRAWPSPLPDALLHSTSI